MITNKFVKILVRIFYYFLVGSVIYFTINFIFQIYYNYPREYVFALHLGTILVTVVVTEGLLIINRVFEKRGGLFKNQFTRFTLQSIADLLFVILVVTFSGVYLMLNYGTGGAEEIITHFDLLTINLISIIYAFIVVITKALFDTYRNLNQSMIKIERFRKESTEAKLQSLKNQLSPHFLFNTLNTLYSIIDKDSELAKEYLMKISESYRYILANEKNEIIQLESEIDFAKDYAFLINKRYGGGFAFELDVPDEYKDKYIPLLTLQVLVENALKHNKLDKDEKLTLQVSVDSEGMLNIKNNIIRKKEAIQGPGMGLENLKNRYKYLIDKEIEVEESDEYFTVKVPLINVEQYESINHRR